jgi:hypothetical protein
MMAIDEQVVINAMANAIVTTIIVVMASRSEKKEAHAIAFMSAIVMMAALIWSARLQQIAIPLLTLTLIVAFDDIVTMLQDTKPKEAKIIIAIAAIALLFVTIPNTTQTVMHIAKALPNAQRIIIENDTMDPSLGYPTQDMTKNIEGKTVLARANISTYLEWLGAKVMINSRFETIAQDERADAIATDIIILEARKHSSDDPTILPYKDGITNQPIDVIIAEEGTLLEDLLNRSESWKASAKQNIMDTSYTRFDNTERHAFETQGIAKYEDDQTPSLKQKP